MKLSETIQYINKALNYPALTYVDIDIFFDMAIAELNTTLHTSIPTIKFLVEDFKHKVLKAEENKIILSSNPENNDFEIPVYDTEQTPSDTLPYYCNSSTKKFYILNKYSNSYTEHTLIKGVWVEDATHVHIYQSVYYGGTTAIWMETAIDPTYECDISDIMPDDWVLLWLIPYVCYKYTARDGGTAQTFAEELTQGYQQLQETYDIPSKVILATYADKPIYKELVEKSLPNLNIFVPTKGIFENMKHSRNTNAIYGSMYDRGGF